MLKDYDKFNVKPPFYNGYKLLSLLDKNGNKPEIYVSSTNRSAGKTTFFNGLVVHNFIKSGKKFLLLYRNKYEMDSCVDGFFNDIHKIFYKGLQMKQETGVKDVFKNLYIAELGESPDWQLCGYCTALSASEQIKKYSHLLSDVSIILFDEFQSESDTYLKKEVSRFNSIHDSLARGNGEQVKYLPTVLIGNLIDLFNPYYVALGIVDNLQLETKYLRGDGFIVEQGFNEASATSHAESAFHRALAGTEYTKVSQQKEYLQTSYQFIDNKVADLGVYMFTIRYQNKDYSVRYNDNGSFYYVSNTPDPYYKLKHAATMDDVSADAFFDPTNTMRTMLKNKMRVNMVKFKNLTCRDAAMHFIVGK